VAETPLPQTARMKPLRTELAQFTGSTQWFRHSFNRAVIYTQGIQYLAFTPHCPSYAWRLAERESND